LGSIGHGPAGGDAGRGIGTGTTRDHPAPDLKPGGPACSGIVEPRGKLSGDYYHCTDYHHCTGCAAKRHSAILIPLRNVILAELDSYGFPLIIYIYNNLGAIYSFKHNGLFRLSIMVWTKSNVHKLLITNVIDVFKQMLVVFQQPY
jgi:hypothetical protein